MSYVNAPATALLATHCCCCGRPLVDAVSVQLGIGPDCRKQYNAGITPEVQDECNRLTHAAAVAAQRGNLAEVETIAGIIRVLGLDVLADAICKRFTEAAKKADIAITERGDLLLIETPYKRDPAFVAAWRAVPGRRWDRESGLNATPKTSKGHVWSLLCEFFPGHYGTGPRGLFRVPTSKES